MEPLRADERRELNMLHGAACATGEQQPYARAEYKDICSRVMPRVLAELDTAKAELTALREQRDRGADWHVKGCSCANVSIMFASCGCALAWANRGKVVRDALVPKDEPDSWIRWEQCSELYRERCNMVYDAVVADHLRDVAKKVRNAE